MGAIARQPLFQFLVLGLILFFLDSWLLDREDDPRRIVIDDAKYLELAGVFRDNQGREPTDAEMAELTLQWAQNEVLYREARLMGLDKGDEMIRNRLVLKLRNIFFNRVEDPVAEAGELEAWFEANRARYDLPEMYDWEQVFLGADLTAEQASETLEEFTAEAVPERFETVVRRYPHRPFINIETLFGEADAVRLTSENAGDWLAADSPKGWHAARVTKTYPAKPAVFADFEHRVRREWQKETMDLELRSAMAAMASGYDIRVEVSENLRNLPEEALDPERLVVGEAAPAAGVGGGAR